MLKFICYFFLSLFSLSIYAQYPPAAGQMGSTAIYKDSSVFIDWANTCSITRGFINLGDTSFEDPAYPGTNRASFGNATAAIGIADNNTVSLGDNGNAILSFAYPIVNGQGFDFAVFENSFDDFFLELAFVEVSSDGIHYVRFPSVSLTQSNTQIQGFGTLDPTKIHNLAGKYKVFYGTPFDLSDLQDSAGIDIHHITHIKIIDVVGSISEPLMSYDSQGHIINDPFPTAFWTGGFDLDAVGVLHNTQNTGINTPKFTTDDILIYPNPATDWLEIRMGMPSNYKAQITDIVGKIIAAFEMSNSTKIDVRNLPKGLYFISLKDGMSNIHILKFFKNK